ncbi:uncharacterized protein LOC121728697 isoform X2 [Aricia agestis]|uniref:uncharacterized protein LOC121728697 isoform X2 n=1 Tax=Aricia agestis TaxID=91739 RepID=UPI001C20682F|nr:uncharacterized protein LOC121728697 isoform X2 [Aricia agestis]
MERILLFFVVLVLVDGFKHQSHHPKFPKQPDEGEHIRKVACDSSHDRLRNELIEKSQCGEPKEVFVELPVTASYLQVSPSSVWVKRCVGLCDFEAPGSKCVATKTRFEAVPVRIYNAKTKKETCSTYNVEVHEACGCCAATAASCGAPRVFNPPEPEYEVESV